MNRIVGEAEVTPKAVNLMAGEDYAPGDRRRHGGAGRDQGRAKPSAITREASCAHQRVAVVITSQMVMVTILWRLDCLPRIRLSRFRVR
jgi:hypothetical protein